MMKKEVKNMKSLINLINAIDNIDDLNVVIDVIKIKQSRNYYKSIQIFRYKDINLNAGYISYDV